MPTPGLLGACSRARREATTINGTSLVSVSRLRALRALPARALPLPYPCSPPAARGWVGPSLPRADQVLRISWLLALRSPLECRGLDNQHEHEFITALIVLKQATARAVTPSRPTWERAPREAQLRARRT